MVTAAGTRESMLKLQKLIQHGEIILGMHQIKLSWYTFFFSFSLYKITAHVLFNVLLLN